MVPSRIPLAILTLFKSLSLKPKYVAHASGISGVLSPSNQGIIMLPLLPGTLSEIKSSKFLCVSVFDSKNSL